MVTQRGMPVAMLGDSYAYGYAPLPGQALGQMPWETQQADPNPYYGPGGAPEPSKVQKVFSGLQSAFSQGMGAFNSYIERDLQKAKTAEQQAIAEQIRMSAGAGNLQQTASLIAQLQASTKQNMLPIAMIGGVAILGLIVVMNMNRRRR